MQDTLLYAYGSITIVSFLFLFIIIANEAGFNIGRFIQKQTDEEIKALTGAIQASILGLLALLLGFTFSMSMNRYDSRSEAVIAEANTIGTAVLRSQLLPDTYQQQAHDYLQEYIQLRLSVSKLDLTMAEERKAYLDETAQLQTKLWNIAVALSQDNVSPAITGAFINALNDMFDAQARRIAKQGMQVPEVVIFLLFIVFIASGAMLGYSAGLSGKRVVAPTIMVSFLISLIVFIIIDLDRPKRGVIQVDQSSLVQLANSIGEAKNRMNP